MDEHLKKLEKLHLLGRSANLKGLVSHEFIFLIIILMFAFFLRIYSLGYSPLWIDETTSSMTSKMILEKGVPIFDSGAFYGRAYVFHYTEAFFLLFGVNDFNARLASVLFGMLTIVLAYFIGKEYSKAGGIISALFISVFSLEVFFSRQARFYQLFQLMLFLCIYLLYKSGEERGKKRENLYLILAIISFFIALDTQIAALVLAPFFILHILIFNKHKYLAIIPLIPLIQKYMPAIGLSSGSSEIAANYADKYLAFTKNLRYMVILFIPGVLLGGIKKWKLTGLMVLPSIIMLVGIFSLQTFALRYSYFMVFPIIIYFSVLISFLYDKLGKLTILFILFLLIFPSNLVFPHTYVNVIKPINYNFNDYSAPFTDYKAIPEEVMTQLKDKNNTLISLFSSDVEWYIRKPDYAIPFSMDGRGDDQISFNKIVGGEETGEIVDTYSGAPILTNKTELKGEYYVTQDSYSYSKLKLNQKERFDALVRNCSAIYESKTEDLKIWAC
jgi:hypothetical protein